MQSLRSSSLATRAFAPAQTGRRAAVVVRVKPTAAGDYRALSAEELIQKAASLKAEYTKLQYLKRTRGKVTNPETLQVRWLAWACLCGDRVAALVGTTLIRGIVGFVRFSTTYLYWWQWPQAVRRGLHAPRQAAARCVGALLRCMCVCCLCQCVGQPMMGRPGFLFMSSSFPLDGMAATDMLF
jgi:ribosomal protein L29